MKKGFFAYSSYPSSCGQAIEIAISEINKSEDYYIKSWTSMSVNGRLISLEILKEIEDADFFCADITGINDNVLFEMGYALAKNKPMFIVFDTSMIESYRRYNELNLLTDLGYNDYQNSSSIIEGFYKFASSRYFDEGLYDTIIKRFAKSTERKALLYLKSKYLTDSTKIVSNTIRDKRIPVTIDDAQEVKVQPLSWYIEEISSVQAILCEFMATSRSGFEIQNSKSAFIAGIGHGLNLDILMICEEPYNTPIDYREILQKYSNPQKCENIISPFVNKISDNIIEILTTKNILAKKSKIRTEFQNIRFGDFIAENEIEDLYEYFIETLFYSQLLNNNVNIVVGRKGAGKSATLYYLKDKYSRDKKNIICVIKPLNFEIDGLVSLIEQINGEYEKNFLVEAIWKFLVISEIAKKVFENISNKPKPAVTRQQEEFRSYINSNKELYFDDISTRLENCIDKIKEKIGNGLSQNEYKAKITEALHLDTVYSLKQYFANVIDKDETIIVLIDNLDKSWKKDNKISIIGRIIFGLINSVERIVGDIFIIKQKHKNLKFNLTLFLRSDIYSNIIQHAPEPDKINPIWLRWNDYEVFFRIIEERFSVINNKDSSDLWHKYLADEVNGEKIKDFIISRVLPRPRDIIYFFKTALSTAIVRGHEKVTPDDFIKAYKEYSTWVFSSLIVENGITFKQMEDFMYGFAGSKQIITFDEILNFLSEAKIDSKDLNYVERFIDHLVSLSILGRETNIDNFEFEFEFDLDRKNKVLNSRLQNRRFKIHPVLYPYLDIVE
ncbi:hypothetical protein EMA8858_00518 [Emticicia aquatica]|uniref:Uncharacterized protein n=1 Tax=Emticicia aquatica TaxID=1681835 RepID=A0ABN8ENG2_9BACT|nr:nucleoside 2-deoxyribosyltransferase [Emticicia aquatica]CAH0994409.1 hypothetical protein EMA8858_00518 [Emticicia aquatica]